MQVSDNGLKFIAQMEGIRLKPYLDSAKIPTIGIGTITYPNGKKVTMQDAPITEAQALEYLKDHITKFVLPCLSKVTVSLTQNQVDAIVSFIYNLGCGNFSSSTLLKKINGKAPLAEIKENLLKWNRAAGKEIPGLTNRRIKEFELYSK